MAQQIPMIIPQGYYDKLGMTTIRTPIAIERMMGNPNPIKVTNPLFPMTNRPNRSANEAALNTIRVADASNQTPLGKVYQQMGATPEFYTKMLGDARQNLVRMPDGSLAVAAPTSKVRAIDVYPNGTPIGGQRSGPISAPATPLVSHKVNTIRIDPESNQPITTAPKVNMNQVAEREAARLRASHPAKASEVAPPPPKKAAVARDPDMWFTSKAPEGTIDKKVAASSPSTSKKLTGDQRRAIASTDGVDIIKDVPVKVASKKSTGTIDTTAALDNKYLGLTATKPQNPAVAAIDEVAPPLAARVAPQPHQRPAAGPFAYSTPEQQARPITTPVQRTRAPQPRGPLNYVSAPVMPRQAPQQIVQRQASNGPITYDLPLVTPGNDRPQILGLDMAFMPASVQRSSRWNDR